MTNDASRLQNDLHTIISTLSPEIPLDLISIRLEEVLYNYHVQHRAAAEMEHDLSDKIHLYLCAKEIEGLASDTLEDYQLELGLFANYMKKAVVQIQTPDIRDYLSSLENVEMSTVGKKLSVLRSFFGWMVQEEILLKNPTKKVRSPKKKKRLPKSLNTKEFEWVREMCITRRERALVEVLYSTGCRLSELKNLQIAQVDRQDMSARVIGKGDKERRVYFSYTAMYHLDRYLESRSDNCPYLFVTLRRPFRKMHSHTIEDEIRKLGDRAGLAHHLTPHQFRHTLAQNMLNNGAKLEEVQHVLGHAEISTTTVYAQVSEEQKRSAHKRYS